MAAIWWEFAHKAGARHWDLAIGSARCPYCHHRQDRHVIGIDPADGDLVFRCDDCGQYGVEQRDCLILPARNRSPTIRIMEKT